MNFIEPFFLVGLLAAALPLIIHLINRKKASRVPFPAMKFVLQSQKRVAKGAKIRQWILLALRALALALLALALAKPFFKSQEGLTMDQRLPTASVIVLDTSYSMTTGDGWEQVEEMLETEVSRLRPWDEVSLITSDLRVDTGKPSTDHNALKRAVNQVEPGFHALGFNEALLQASDHLNTSQLPNRRIVLITDGARGALEDAAPQVAWPVEVRKLELESPKSVAISEVNYAQEGARRDRIWRIEATLVNLSNDDQNAVQIDLMIGENTVASGRVDISAGKSATHVFRYKPDSQAAQSARVRIPDADELATDNERWFSLAMSDQTRVLLVNGEPSTVAYEDELFFAERALALKNEEASMTLSVTSREGFEARDLQEFDVILVANIAQLTAQSAEKLKAFVEGGGGLLVTMGGQVDVSWWNQALGEVLPKPLRSQKLLAEMGDPDAPVKVTRFGLAQSSHPIFEAFTAPGGGTLQSAEVYSYMLLEPSPPDSKTSILMSYKDGAPALLERELGSGRVLLLTTSIDMDWTDLPTRTSYLPLMRRMTQYLARRVTSDAKGVNQVGSEVAFDVKGLSAERVIALSLSGAEVTRLVETPDEDGVVRFRVWKPGVYEVYLDDETPEKRRPALDFSVNVDTAEANLSPLPDEFFLAFNPGGESAKGPSQERRVSVWPFLLFVFTIFLLLESVLGTRRSVLVRLWRTLTRRPQEADALD